MYNVVNWSTENQARAPPSSIVKASRARKKGGVDRPAWLRCGKEDQGQEAPHPSRYPRLAAPRPCTFGGHPGSRRRGAGDGHAVRPASIPAEALCRRRLSRADLSVRRSQNPPANRRGDRQALRYRKGLCGLAQAMDRRTHHRLAQPLPPFGQGLGVPQPKGIGVLAPRLNPLHAAKALSKNIMIPDRLLGIKRSLPSEPSRAQAPLPVTLFNRSA